MIHPSRRHLVRTRELLAQDMGTTLGTLRNKKPYAAQGFPAPISSDGARVLLWDGGQTAAYLAGEPVPALPDTDGPEVLLDRQEAAAELKVTPRTWDGYKTDPQLSRHLMDVHGVEHWPRQAVHAFRDGRPGKESASGRPKGKADAVPRGELRARVAVLLDATPAVTIADTCRALGVAPATAQRVLAQLRGERIGALMETSPALSFDQAADRLGYPAAVRRGARDVLVTAGAETEG
ncbi:hypothetical protein E0500_030615 [Streptomyces sp. KM273126]|uniref:hypothetical protein n=1 Tax=Streptomyces sp. KM273126 TaxID=2545247 RepID=UPI0014043A6E|nr:hypothetical protein [Streptomyces sp. KM273126]MBA2811564.1 hypothetical protein [Streptomyces sp. KM273126]